MPAMFNNELKATIQHNAAVTEIKAMFLYYLKWITDDNSLWWVTLNGALLVINSVSR